MRDYYDYRGYEDYAYPEPEYDKWDNADAEYDEWADKQLEEKWEKEDGK